MKKLVLAVVVLAVILFLSRTHTQAQTPILWGMASGDGADRGGVLFSFTSANGQLFDGHSFGAGTDGDEPFGSFIQARNGLLYGVTSIGGAVDSAKGGDGTLFSFDIVAGTETRLYSFGKGADGQHPSGTLLQVNDSVLYGTTTTGGKNGMGTIFSYNIVSDTEIKLHDFGADTDGQNPWGALIQVRDSLLFGMTIAGGIYGNGIIFNYNITTGEENIVHHFNLDNADGGSPSGALLQVGDSLLYGLTAAGGNDGEGTLFSLNSYTDSEAVVHNFLYLIDGTVPEGSLLLVGDSLLYGLTSTGGAYDTINHFGSGTIFRYDITAHKDEVLYSFGREMEGHNPQGSLMMASDGRLYGTTEQGGANDTAAGGDGTIFSYDIASGGEVDLYDFNQASGAFPFGDLLEVDTMTGVKQLAVINGQLTVYPNPSADFIIVTITSPTTLPVQLSLYNILGQQVYSASARLYPNATISVTDLPDGIYVLRVRAGGTIEQKEIVVAR